MGGFEPYLRPPIHDLTLVLVKVHTLRSSSSTKHTVQIILNLTDADQCRAENGQCRRVSDGCNNGRFRVGLCPGDADNKCCVPYPSSKLRFINNMKAANLIVSMLLCPFLELFSFL